MEYRGIPLDTIGAVPYVHEHRRGFIDVEAAWCTYLQPEIAALERLAKEYEGLIPIIAVGLDVAADELKRPVRAPPPAIRWLHASLCGRLRDDLQLRSLPAFFNLQDGKLTNSPAPLPSEGRRRSFTAPKSRIRRPPAILNTSKPFTQFGIIER